MSPAFHYRSLMKLEMIRDNRYHVTINGAPHILSKEEYESARNVAKAVVEPPENKAMTAKRTKKA